MVEVWGGIECSVVRVGGVTRNQLAETGHSKRVEDLDLVASLGIKTLRYPALWEHVEPLEGQDDWNWLDERFQRMRQLGISPIAALVHHGSGPCWTSILAPDFAERLAAFGGRLARRYPWVKTFTPINEPMATARLSGLYGFWHPHRADEPSCLRLLVAQCLAIAMTMSAIRKVIPDARLLQTEDFGKIFATPKLTYQAEYENGRRWLSLDLLCGHVGQSHPFHERLLDAGVDAAHLAELEGAPALRTSSALITTSPAIDSSIIGSKGTLKNRSAATASIPMSTSPLSAPTRQPANSDLPRACARCGAATLYRWQLEKCTTPAPVRNSCGGSWRDGRLQANARLRALTYVPSLLGQCSAPWTGIP